MRRERGDSQVRLEEPTRARPMVHAEGYDKPSRSLASTCSALAVTGSGLPSGTSVSSTDASTTILSPGGSRQDVSVATADLDGIYEDSEQVVSSRPVFYETGDYSNMLYWTEGVSPGVRQRRLGQAEQTEVKPGWMSRPHLLHPRVSRNGDNWASNEIGGGGNAPLAACDRGAWIIRSTNGTFPAYLVFDCASHPADVTSDDWFSITCRDCQAEPVDGSFSMECFEESTDDSSIDYDFGGYTPSPTPPPFTNSPAVHIMNGFPTIAPGVAVEVESVDTSSSCETIDVINAEDDGEYTATGFDTNGRYLFEHSSGSTLQWYSSNSRRRLSLWDRWMEKTESEVDVALARAARPPLGDRRIRGAGGRERTGRGLEGLPKGSNAGEISAVEQELDVCDDGAWIFVGASGSYPIILAYDCSIHPADIDTTWYNQESVSDYAYERDSQVDVSCPGGTSSSSFSPGARVANRQADNDIDDDSLGSNAGDGGGASGGGGGGSTEGILISGGLLLGLAVIGACVLSVWCWRNRAKKSRDNGSNDSNTNNARPGTYRVIPVRTEEPAVGDAKPPSDGDGAEEQRGLGKGVAMASGPVATAVAVTGTEVSPEAPHGSAGGDASEDPVLECSSQAEGAFVAGVGPSGVLIPGGSGGSPPPGSADRARSSDVIGTAIYGVRHAGAFGEEEEEKKKEEEKKEEEEEEEKEKEEGKQTAAASGVDVKEA